VKLLQREMGPVHISADIGCHSFATLQPFNLGASIMGYGLGAAGEAGVRRAIEILRADLLRTIKLLGCPSTSELDRSYVELPDSWQH